MYIYLLAHGVFDVREHKFLISGHSFMGCDRDFGHIEKRKRVMKAMIPEDLHNIIKSAVYNPPFEIVDMEKHGFWNLKEAAEDLIDIKNLNIRKAAKSLASMINFLEREEHKKC
ncbi:f-box/tpr repeat protein pof3 [Holotrichia oblita]|uniref:F-box/tpr repeat protein pof3 n=1 Tax=Holotrichia oblita TaxID=644536 RepID=A0ACB9SUJ8_HOLOL|nr:f-box/tpr repeat protein pof3 [Holotrichia oblita]